MVKCTVVNCKNTPYDVYVGRPSKWGNPFSHLANTQAKFRVATRKEAIKKYEEYLLNNEELMNSLHELVGKKLGCWCYPKSCHAEILKKYADSLTTSLFS